MNTNEIYPYYHPVKTVFIDDDISFLNSLSPHIESDNFECFSDIKESLKTINTSPKPVNDAKQIISRASDENRFQETAVIVLDYQMPAINGIDLAIRISNKNIKKIILTGALPQGKALDVMNCNLVDGYIAKNDPDMALKLNSVIDIQTERFFSQVKDRFKISMPEYIEKASFKLHFSRLINNFDIIEYYYSSQHEGFIMRCANGTSYFLSVTKATKIMPAFSPYDRTIDDGDNYFHCVWIENPKLFSSITNEYNSYNRKHLRKEGNVYYLRDATN